MTRKARCRQRQLPGDATGARQRAPLPRLCGNTAHILQFISPSGFPPYTFSLNGPSVCTMDGLTHAMNQGLLLVSSIVGNVSRALPSIGMLEAPLVSARRFAASWSATTTTISGYLIPPEKLLGLISPVPVGPPKIAFKRGSSFTSSRVIHWRPFLTGVGPTLRPNQ